MLSNKVKVISVTGPTCTGKSALSVLLAEKFDGEIINCDSMQVYKYFDIGTAKPDADMRKRVPHHLIDVVEPQEEFNAARFKEMADHAIRFDTCAPENTHSRGRNRPLSEGFDLWAF